MSSNAEEVPQGNTRNDEYVSRQGAKNESVPVQSDQDTVQDPIDPNTADTDAQLERDDTDAIDQGNIIPEKTRNAKPSGGYREPGDNEGIPVDNE